MTAFSAGAPRLTVCARDQRPLHVIHGETRLGGVHGKQGWAWSLNIRGPVFPAEGTPAPAVPWVLSLPQVPSISGPYQPHSNASPQGLPEVHTVQGPHEAACHELLTRPDGPALWDRGLWEGKSQGPLPPSFSPLKGGLTALGRGLGPCPQGQRWDQLRNQWASVQSGNVEPLVQR